MYVRGYEFIERFRWLILGIFVLFAMLIASSLLIPPVETGAQAATPASTEEVVPVYYDSPNAVTNGMAGATDTFSRSMASTEKALTSGGRSVAVGASRTGRAITHSLYTGASFVGRGVGNGAGLVARGVSNSALFLAHAATGSFAFVVGVPGNVLGFAGDTALVSAVIEPAGDTKVPLIDPSFPITYETTAPMPASQTTSQVTPTAKVVDSAAAWPIRGDITTLFGVPHWPYQPVHTGLDISDGQPAGVTPIRPFKPGTVVDVAYSKYGLGNHIVVDHRGGLTSVYGHLASASVQIGQAVETSTVLGFEGSTGASTGTHLHFEIRLNGQATDPLPYLAGQP